MPMWDVEHSKNERYKDLCLIKAFIENIFYL